VGSRVKLNRAASSPPQPAPATALRPIGGITVGKRIRSDLGDIEGLAKSIAEIGLLHPIVITPDGRLIVGVRRLLAAKMLGWKEIPVTIRSAPTTEAGQRASARRGLR
jgi:ParB-like chromosome segregation protein Spo0J